MATNFPTSLDSLTNPTSTDTLASPSHSGQHADANDAIEALEAKVGVDGSAVTTSHSYKIAGLEGKQYVTLASDSQLSSERVLTAGTGITVTDAGAGSTVTVATSAILPTVVDAKGDLIAGTANDTVARVAVGSNNQVLTADSAQTAGVKWATPVTVATDTLWDAKGDLAVGSGADTAAKLTVGSNGDMLVADSSATSGLRWQGQMNTGRNLVINGAMQVAQRGTSVTGNTAGGYVTADRWNLAIGSLGTWTIDIQTDAPTGNGFGKSFRMLCTTADASPAAGDFCFMRQTVEGQDIQRIRKGTSSAEQITVSFWVKSNATGTYVVELLDSDNSRAVSLSYTVSASATWEKKTITFPADTTGAFDNDNAGSLQIGFWLAAGSTWSSGTLQTTWGATTNGNRAVGQTNLAAATNNYWQVTGVQLEVGAVATGFDFEPYETTLRKCQRYYYRITADASNRHFTVGHNASTTENWSSGRFPVTMRVRPTALETTGTAADYRVQHTNTSTACSAVPTFGAPTTTDVFWCVFTVGSAALTAGQGSAGQSNAANAYLGWSAEL